MADNETSGNDPSVEIDQLFSQVLKENEPDPVDRASKIVKEVEEQFRNNFISEEEKDRRREEGELKEALKKLKSELKKQRNVKTRSASTVVRDKDGKVSLASKNVNKVKHESRQNIKKSIAEIELRLEEIEMEKKPLPSQKGEAPQPVNPKMTPNFTKL